MRDPSLYLGLKPADRPRTEAGQRGKCSPGNPTVNSVRQSPVQSSSLVRTQLTSPTSHRVPAFIVSRALFGLYPFAPDFFPFWAGQRDPQVPRSYYPFLPDYRALRTLTGGGPNRELFFATRWKDAVRESDTRQNPRYEVGTVMSVVHMFLFLPSFS